MTSALGTEQRSSLRYTIKTNTVSLSFLGTTKIPRTSFQKKRKIWSHGENVFRWYWQREIAFVPTSELVWISFQFHPLPNSIRKVLFSPQDACGEIINLSFWVNFWWKGYIGDFIGDFDNCIFPFGGVLVHNCTWLVEFDRCSTVTLYNQGV